MRTYGFDERRAFSEGVVRATCEETIKQMLDGCVTVTKTGLDLDKSGVDYIATLRKGAEVWIDHKAREKGCGRYWDCEPEFALETWSVCPENGRPGKAGWTCDESKKTHYTLHTFDPVDTPKCWLLPFQLLRVTFRRRGKEWATQYPVKRQNSGGWRSECMFVPVSVVLEEMNRVMEFTTQIGATP